MQQTGLFRLYEFALMCLGIAGFLYRERTPMGDGMSILLYLVVMILGLGGLLIAMKASRRVTPESCKRLASQQP
jgi:hypothetical protein